MVRRNRALLLVLFLAGCEETSRSKDAKIDTERSLVEDLTATRHPADGGGRAFFDPGIPTRARAGEPIALALTYEAGPLGIAEGGALFLQPSPFWGWDSPRTDIADAPGAAGVSTDAEGVSLETTAFDGLLAIHVRGRNLEPGERVHITYLTRADRFAERTERIWIAVDGDGDGVRAVVVESPTIDVLAGKPARLVLTLPTTARPGEIVRLVVAALDSLGNRGVELEDQVELRSSGELGLPESVSLPEGGVLTLEVPAVGEGIYRVRASTPGGLSAESNPLVVRGGIPRVLWGDLHGHSQISDGTGTPDDYFAYARDVAALDVIALTDHDHWGMRFLDDSPALWKTIEDAARRFDDPGRFVALVGYEWTSWLHGHRHVLYFEGEAAVLSSLDPRYENPALLWEALEGRSAVTIAHHSAGGPVSTNWEFIPPPELEPVTEVVSVHGSSEASDTPGKIYSPVPGNFVRDALDRGLRFGFIGSGDSHDGHPGLAHLASPSGGLAAIFSEDRTRSGALEALRARRTYATNGPRIWLRTWLDEHEMGALIPPSDAAGHELRFVVAAPAPVDRVDVVRSGEIVNVVRGGGRRELGETLVLPPLRRGEYVYVRVVQEDGGAAWSSPIYVTSESSRE
jgi:Protein of unknown function (DUF3604)